MKRFSVQAIFLVVIAVFCNTQSYCQAGSSQPEGQQTAEAAAHGLRHLEQLSRVAAFAAPDPASQKILNQQLLPPTKTNFGAINSTKELPTDVRSAAKDIAKTKRFDALSAELSKQSNIDSLSSSQVFGESKITNTVYQVDQVLTTKLPAGPVGTTPLSPSSIVSSCKPPGIFFPRLVQSLGARTDTITTIANSVGRIEIRVGGNVPTLQGTAFVVDRANGIVATACHVANQIADLDKATNTWNFPSGSLGAGATIWIDFGSTDQHDPAMEFQITGIRFVPTVTGCDGALLSVDSHGRRLPPALTLASAELASPLPDIVDVFSIGYPSRDLTGSTPETRDYFSCLRSSSPLAAKFMLGGQVTEDEAKAEYHILPHIVPTVPGQSGSPIIRIGLSGEPTVIGIHICCVQSAHITQGPDCQLRNEPYLQEAISIVDLMRLYNVSAKASLNQPGLVEAR